jgi:ABC-type branched-subunit amino acid transport system permease subunit
MYGAYTFSSLRETGQYPIPPLPNPLSIGVALINKFGAHLRAPGIPTFINFDHPMSVVPAILATVGTGLVIGLGMHYLVFQPMRDQPILAKLVASVGIMITLQSIITLRYTSDPFTAAAIFGTSSVRVLGTPVPTAALFISGIAVGITLIFAWAYRYSRLGWSVQAVVQSRKGAILSGLSPDRMAGISWVVASVIAVVMGLMFGSLTALTPTNFTLYILPALAAVFMAGLRSFIGATVAAFVIAAVEAVAIPLGVRFPVLPPGLGDGVPLVLIICMLLVYGKRLPTRADDAAHALPRAPIPRMSAGAVVLMLSATAAGCLFLPLDFRGALINSLVFIPLGVSIVILVGFAGQLSLLQLPLAGVAGLAMTRIAIHVPFPFAPLLAALVATVVGVLVAWPSLQVRGTNLAIVSLAGALAFSSVVLQDPSILFAQTVPAPTIFGINLGVNGRFPIGLVGEPSATFALLSMVVAVLALVILRNVRVSTVGRSLLAVRTSEVAASSTRVNVVGMKLLAAAIAGFLAGITGAMSAYQFNSVNASAYDPISALAILATVYLAGISRFSGAVLAGVLVAGGLSSQILINLSANAPAYYTLLTAVALIVTVVANPQGIAGTVAEQVATIKKRLSRRTASMEPA